MDEPQTLDFSKSVPTDDQNDSNRKSWGTKWNACEVSCELLEEESQFADGNQVTETGALLHNGTTLTTSWNSYGNSEGIKILDI